MGRGGVFVQYTMLLFRVVKNTILLPEKLRLNIQWEFIVLKNKNSHFIKIAWTVVHIQLRVSILIDLICLFINNINFYFILSGLISIYIQYTVYVTIQYRQRLRIYTDRERVDEDKRDFKFVKVFGKRVRVYIYKCTCIKGPFQYRWRIAVQSEPNASKGKERYERENPLHGYPDRVKGFPFDYSICCLPTRIF